jgi:hypothetical protein
MMNHKEAVAPDLMDVLVQLINIAGVNDDQKKSKEKKP